MSAISVVNSLDLLRAIDEAYKEKKQSTHISCPYSISIPLYLTQADGKHHVKTKKYGTGKRLLWTVIKAVVFLNLKIY